MESMYYTILHDETCLERKVNRKILKRTIIIMRNTQKLYADGKWDVQFLVYSMLEHTKLVP